MIASKKITAEKKNHSKDVRIDIDESLFSYDELFSHTKIGVYRNTSGPKGHFLQANTSIVRMFEAGSKKEFLRHNVSDLYQNPADRAVFVSKILKNGFVESEELALRTLKGRNITGAVTAVMKKDEYGNIYFDGIIEDISERKNAEQKIQRLANLYRALSECNQTIMRVKSREELFQKICKDMVSFGGMRMVWIGLIDPKTKMIKEVASAGIGTEYLRNIKISIDADVPFGRGPTGTAMREKRPFWCQNFQNDPDTAPWHKIGLRFGWKSSAALPLYTEESVVGALSLYSDEVNAFDAAARNLLIEVSSDVSYALDKLAGEAKRISAEKNLKASEARYRKLIETEPECVKMVTKDNILLDMNPAGLALIEADSLEQVVGKSLLEIIDPEYREVFADVTRQVFLGKKASAQFKLIGLKGGKKWLETHAVPLLDEGGKIYSLLAVTLDITARKQAEAALQESEYFFRESQSAGSIGSYKLDFASGLWESSEVLDSILGIAKSYGKSIPGWLKIVHPDDKEMMSRYLTEEVVGRQKNFNKKYRIIRKSDGEIRWVNGLGQVKFGAKGNAVSMIGTIQDITEQKKNEDLLKSRVDELEKLKTTLVNLLEELEVKEKEAELEKSKYEVLLGNITDGVIAIDTDKKIIYVNDEAVRLIGISGKDLIGKIYFQMWSLRNPDGDMLVPQEERPFTLALKGESRKVRERYVLERKDGKKIPISISIAPIIASGKITGANVVIRDITKQLEIDRAKNEFISVASHQLRTPLSSMKWLIEALLSSKNLGDREKIRLENIFISNERLIVLVNDLLSISRMESGKFMGEVQLFDMANLLRRAIKEYAPEAEKTGKKIVLSLSKTADKIKGNPVLISEALNNVLSNAIIYGRKDSAVTVKMAHINGAYLISVNNVDHFIPEEDRDKIFTKFFRASSAKLIRPEGSGLGLYISKMGIEKNGGTIWFESNEKDGTTFYFTVPISAD